MRKIVDSNQLQSEQLRNFLVQSRKNFAVLTDYSAMEAYKGDTLFSIYKSMKILCDFPEQVIVLKNTRLICRLNGKGSGLQKRLIDDAQTKGFSTYVRHLTAAKAGNASLQQQLLEHGKKASAHLDRMINDAASILDAFGDIAKLYSKMERATIRKGEPYSTEMIQKAVKNICQIAAELFYQHPDKPAWPTCGDVKNTFIFRISLCMYLLAMEWAANGGTKDASVDRVRNDMVDMNFVAYATYFDGILTSDKKVIRLHREARIWLSALFGCHLHGELT